MCVNFKDVTIFVIENFSLGTSYQHPKNPASFLCVKTQINFSIVDQIFFYTEN